MDDIEKKVYICKPYKYHHRQMWNVWPSLLCWLAVWPRDAELSLSGRKAGRQIVVVLSVVDCEFYQIHRSCPKPTETNVYSHVAVVVAVWPNAQFSRLRNQISAQRQLFISEHTRFFFCSLFFLALLCCLLAANKKLKNSHTNSTSTQTHHE